MAGAALVQGATTILLAQGWRVLAPPDGMPRVLASREAPDAHLGRDELQQVLVPATRPAGRAQQLTSYLETGRPSGGCHRCGDHDR